jgi:hypothetical protein
MIFDEIISSDYVDHGQSAYIGSAGRGIDVAKNDLRFSLDRLDDLNYVAVGLATKMQKMRR